MGQSAYLYEQFPTIRLHGRWLENLGFRIGQKVLVEEGQGHLTISIIPSEEETVQQGTIKSKKGK